MRLIIALTIVLALLAVASGKKKARKTVRAACPPIVGNCYVFPPKTEIYRPIDKDPVDYMSDCVMSTFRSWGDRMWLAAGYQYTNPPPAGMPLLAAKSPKLVPLHFAPTGKINMWYTSSWFDSKHTLVHGWQQSSPPAPGTAFVNYPQLTTPIQGWQGSYKKDPAPNAWDKHAMVIDSARCTLTESWETYRLLPNNGFQVSMVTVFDMKKTLPQYPDGTGSADAAGLPITPLVIKGSEISKGQINHAIRMVASYAQAGVFVHPATSTDGLHANTAYPYYGARFRLKKNFNIKPYGKHMQIVLRAMKKYGVIFADQGNMNTVGIYGEISPGMKPLSLEWPKALHFGQIFEMVQSPNHPIRRSDAAPSPGTCNGKTSNSRSFAPKFNPRCPSPKAHHVKLKKKH